MANSESGDVDTGVQCDMAACSALGAEVHVIAAIPSVPLIIIIIIYRRSS